MTKRGDIYLYVCGLDDLFIVYIVDAIWISQWLYK